MWAALDPQRRRLFSSEPPAAVTGPEMSSSSHQSKRTQPSAGAEEAEGDCVDVQIRCLSGKTVDFQVRSSEVHFWSVDQQVGGVMGKVWQGMARFIGVGMVLVSYPDRRTRCQIACCSGN